MQTTAVVFAVCLLTTPALSQEWDPYGEILEGIFDPPARESDNPALGRQMERWDHEQERAERQLRMEYYRNEMNRQHAISACSSIWNNPEAQAACRRSLGGY